MNLADLQGRPTLAQAGSAVVRRALRQQGLWLDIGSAVVRVRSNSPVLAEQLQRAYAHFPLVADGAWADLHMELRQATGLRRWIKPQVVFHCEGQQPFEPFPADSPLPLFEWACNWLIGQRLNDLLLLHAGVVERDGCALVLPAMPGSGKSTLTAALSQRGWRLLSDEFGTYDPADGQFRAMLKPVALKNQSIQVIRDYSAQAQFGPEFPKTRKGTVAHLAANEDSVRRRHERARPGAVVLPKWEAGSPTRWEPVQPHTLFAALAFNAFNYAVLGEAGFRAAIHLITHCPGWHLVYSDLDDALRTLNGVWPEVVARSQAVPTTTAPALAPALAEAR